MDLPQELQHLTLDQIEELYCRYLAGEKNSDLVQEYKIVISPNHLIKILPPIESQDLSCPYCKSPMYEHRKGKSTSQLNHIPAFCKTCDHRYFFEQRWSSKKSCSCLSCISLEEKEQKKADDYKKKHIEDLLKKLSPIAYNSLNFLDKINLLAVMEAQSNGRFETIFSIHEMSNSVYLSPTENMDKAILKSLYKRNILAVDPASPLTAFELTKGKLSAEIEKVQWIPNITLDGAQRLPLKSIYSAILSDFRDGPLPTWKTELTEAATQAATEDVLQYIGMQCLKLSLNFTAEIKTRQVINQILKNHSIHESCYLANLAIRRAHEYLLNSHVSSKQAANIIPSKILSYSEKAIAEQWQRPFPFKRRAAVPRSEYCKILYDLVLKVDDLGLEKNVHHYVEQACNSKENQLNSRSGSTLYCPSCQSNAIHVEMRANKIVINCKDCIARYIFESHP